MTLTPLVFILLSASLHEACVCIFNLQNLNPQPIVLNANHEFIYPNSTSDSSVEISSGEKIVVSCPGTDFVNFPEISTIRLVCNEQQQFQLEDTAINVNFLGLNCSKDVGSSIRHTDRKCAENAEIIEIGFQVDSEFAGFMDVCFDTEVKSGLYSSYSITKSINHRFGGVETKTVQDEVFNSLSYSVDHLYRNARATLNALVGLCPNSSRYAEYAGMSEMPLGTYNLDLFYPAQIRAANRFINFWPQWSFGNYNWDGMIYSLVKNFFNIERLDLQAFVGTFGIVKLDHVSTGEKIPIYLYVNESVKAIRLPAVTWKLLYHQDTKRAIVLLTVNTPHNYKDYVFCKNILGALSWLDKDRDYGDSSHGFTYACSYHMLKGIIPYLPELDVVDILV